jgi:hypothetical protein
VALKDVPYTEDGKTTLHKPQSYTWRFVKVPSVDPKLLSKAFAEKELAYNIQELEQIISEPSGILNFSNLEVMSLPLNKRPEAVEKDKWQMVLSEIKQKRSELSQRIDALKLDIKDQLLDNLVRNVSSAFGPDVQDGGWIEGLVFRDPDTGEMFKLIDKNVFTMFNKFNWQMRSLLKDSGGNRLRSLLGKMYLRMADAIGHPKLASSASKRYVQSLGGSSEEILKSLSDGVDLESTKTQWLEILDKSEKISQRVFDWYEKNKNKLTKTVQVGSKTYEMKYDGSVDTNTKQSFATMFEEINAIKVAVKSAKTPAQLAGLLVKPEHLNVN